MLTENKIRKTITKTIEHFINEKYGISYNKENDYKVLGNFKYDNNRLALAYKVNHKDSRPVLINRDYQETVGSLTMQSPEMSFSNPTHSVITAAYLNVKYDTNLYKVFEYKYAKNKLAMALTMDDKFIMVNDKGQPSVDYFSNINISMAEKDPQQREDLKKAYQNTVNILNNKG